MMNLFYYPGFLMGWFFVYTGLANIVIGRDRYIDFRPGDAFLMAMISSWTMFTGIPALLLLCTFGLFSMGQFLLITAAILISPPFLTWLFFEMVLLFKRN